MSQADLSRLTGISRSYIAEIEQGIKQPRMRVARLIADALEVGLDDLMS
jgi:transcriptional regulator with XRE-family HTH domain